MGAANLAAASGGASISTLLLIVVGSSTGILGAIIAVAKFGSDRGSAAIAQATGANEALEATLEAVERERDYWRGRYVEAVAMNRELVEQIGARLWGEATAADRRRDETHGSDPPPLDRPPGD